MRTVLLSAALVAAATSAKAGDIELGRHLVFRWCIECHVVAPHGVGGESGPSFVSIASLPGQTEQALQKWMDAPHPPMPDYEVNERENEDIAAYIMSLNE